ncbi:MAG: hypothetical protein FJ171_09920 [Gammaproteobacteria bacterium]|nr:hypothetical protein [Gammaproteobacteria bacterium]
MSGRIGGLPARAIDALIDPQAGTRMCERLPYALFDLRFADGNYWGSEVAAAGGVQDAAGPAPSDERIVCFARAAIMVMWHLHRRARPARASCSAPRRRPSRQSARCRSQPWNGWRAGSRER